MKVQRTKHGTGLVLLAVCAWLAAATAALAQSPADVATRWGLIGGWKLDCSQPTSRANGLLSFVVRDGKLMHDRDFGDTRDSSPVVAGRLGQNGSIELSIYFPGLSQTRQVEWIKDKAGRLRAINNRNIDTNDYTVRDGILTGNGQPTAWQYRCGQGRS